jgi:hypothetical protein
MDRPYLFVERRLIGCSVKTPTGDGVPSSPARRMSRFAISGRLILWIGSWPGPSNLEWTMPPPISPRHTTHCQRWYYFSDMAPDEMIVFKAWDSDPSVPISCPHTAFRLPVTTRADRSSRKRGTLVLRLFRKLKALHYFPRRFPDCGPVGPWEGPHRMFTPPSIAMD